MDLPQPNHPNFDASKARRFAKHPRRAGEDCRAEAGRWQPVVDHGRCEAKADCVAVCPYGVFEVQTIAEQDYRSLTFLQRLKNRMHGKRTAYTPNADACRACGLCVAACPERAIELRLTTHPAEPPSDDERKP